MATTEYWAEAPMYREQIALFSPTLDSAIADDDPVRLFDEVLGGIEWSEWEGEYQPIRRTSEVGNETVNTILGLFIGGG